MDQKAGCLTSSAFGHRIRVGARGCRVNLCVFENGGGPCNMTNAPLLADVLLFICGRDAIASNLAPKGMGIERSGRETNRPPGTLLNRCGAPNLTFGRWDSRNIWLQAARVRVQRCYLRGLIIDECMRPARTCAAPIRSHRYRPARRRILNSCVELSGN